MNSRNDLLFVSIHGAFLTFDPLSCTARMEGTCSTSNADAGDDRTGRATADRSSDKTTSTGWGGLVWNRRSANTGWVRGANPNWDRPAEGQPRKVSDLASFLSALVLFGPNMTHMTH